MLLLLLLLLLLTKRLHDQKFIFFAAPKNACRGTLDSKTHIKKRQNGSVSTYQNSFFARRLQGIKQKKWIIKPWTLTRFLFFYTQQPASNRPIHKPPIFSLEIVQCPCENRNRGRLLSASVRVGVFKGRFIPDYEQKMHTSSLVMETNPPGANRPLTYLAQSCSCSVKANSATLLFWVISNVKSNTKVVGEVHQTFDFTEIESVTILCFHLKVSKKTVVLQRRIQDYLKEGVVSMRVQGKRPWAKKWGRGSWGVMFEYIDFRRFDWRGINLSNLRHYY